jgi:hypothetical protein
MRTLDQIRKSNKREDSLLNTAVVPVILTPEQYNLGRKEYEKFVDPIKRRVFTRYQKNSK